MSDLINDPTNNNGTKITEGTIVRGTVTSVYGKSARNSKGENTPYKLLDVNLNNGTFLRTWVEVDGVNSNQIGGKCLPISNMKEHKSTEITSIEGEYTTTDSKKYESDFSGTKNMNYTALLDYVNLG
ncbi:MAG: hypothetical protein KTR28_01290 [Micavibrio sp.]|nr:hypothetical protein [Micavibrio sp.]